MVIKFNGKEYNLVDGTVKNLILGEIENNFDFYRHLLLPIFEQEIGLYAEKVEARNNNVNSAILAGTNPRNFSY